MSRRRGPLARFRSAANSQTGAAVVFLLAGVAFAAMTAYHLDQNVHLGAGSLVADAVVLQVHERRGRSADSYVVVEFVTAAGQPVRTEVDDYRWSPKPRVGDTARVRYDPDDPQEYVRDERLGPSWWFVGLLAAFSGLFLAGAVAGFRRRLPPWVLHR